MPKAARIPLPVGLDTGSAAALASELREARGAPLTLDATGVERVGALGLQVLLSARLTWARDRKTLRIEGPSPALEAALALAGVELDLDRS
jgi:chemotaxis protein CheX